jgi:predicted ribosome quality control (RQC) complex YloA/Tae2 family protein
MKDQTGLDIRVIVNELSELAGSRIVKFYNTADGELLIKAHNSKDGKFIIRVLKGACIHLTGFDRENSGDTKILLRGNNRFSNPAII